MTLSRLFVKIAFYCGLQLLVFISALLPSSAQTVNKKGVQAEFVVKKTEQLSNELSSNVLRIRNYSDKEVSFSLNISAPEGWAYISKKNNFYTLKGNDSLFVPINLIPKKVSGGNVNHIINASLLSENRMQFASAIWYMSIKKESSWNASVNLNKIFFLDKSDTASFAVRLQNTGNAEEKIKISFIPDRRLRVFGPDKAEIQYFNIILPVNTDTLIYFKAEKLPPAASSFRQDFDAAEQKPQSTAFPLRIIVQNEPGENIAVKTWRSTIDFIQAGKEARLKPYETASLPLTIEATVDNILDNSTILNLNMYGGLYLEKGRNLMYRMQTYFTDNFYNFNPYLGSSHYVGYTSPKTTIEIGDVSGNPNLGFTPTGKGIKASQQILKNQRLGGFYLQSPRLWDARTRTNYGLNHELQLGRNSIENFIQLSDDKLLNLTGRQYSNKVHLNIARFHSLVVSTAFSTEKYNGGTVPVTKNGFAYSVNYSGSFKKLSVSLANSMGTTYNTGYRGIKTLNANLLYRLNNIRSIGAGYASFEQKPAYLTSAGVPYFTRESKNERYELKYNYNPSRYNLSLKLQHLYSEVFNLRSESNGLGMDFRPNLSGELRFFLSAYGAYVKLLDYKIDPYFASQIRSTLRYKGLTTSLRYYYGPYQTYEQLIFASNRSNNQSLFSNTNLRLWVIKDKLTFEPGFVYSYETLYKRHRVSFRPEVYLMPKSGLEVKFYAQYVNNTQKNNPFMNQMDFVNTNRTIVSSNLFFGFGIKKHFGLPISGKKYKKLTVLVFKDLNGNGKKDKNEAGSKNVLVTIKPVVKDSSNFNPYGMKENGESFITDSEGSIIYRNLPRGQYRITIIPLSENTDFFAGNEQIVTLNSDLVYNMPLNRGVQLTGTIAVERDASAADFDKKLDVSKIRITALDSLGKTYTALTDADGRFTLRLPVGVYQISINENALPDNYEPDQRKITLEMFTVSDNYNITFVIREKQRKRQIKKFDKDGNLIENSN